MCSSSYYNKSTEVLLAKYTYMIKITHTSCAERLAPYYKILHYWSIITNASMCTPSFNVVAAGGGTNLNYTLVVGKQCIISHMLIDFLKSLYWKYIKYK